MHTLFVLTLVTASLSPPVLHESRFHLLETMGNDQSNDEAANRIFLEFLAGSGMGVLAGGLTGLSLGSSIESPVSLAIPILSLLLGSSVGVSLVGARLEGRGRFGYALLGSIIGFVAPLVIGIGLLQFGGCAGNFSNRCAQPIVVSLLGLLVLPSVGAMVGYELSAPKSWLLLARAPEELSPPRRVIPVLTLATQGLGVTVGLAGTL
jgi:hypothetical protein